MNALDHAISRMPGSPLLGVAAHTYNPAFVDIAAHLGFDILWIEMEHAPISFSEAAVLCRIASGVGMLSMIRVPDPGRANVLRAAECGPDIIDLPMANSPEILHELVRNARYAPEGDRGFFSSSPAVRYGIGDDIVEERERINSRLCLMGQIETSEAVDRAEEICAVPGIDAILLGLGDLSASLGVCGYAGHPVVRQSVERVISIAKSSGKRVAMACSPDEAAFWMEKGKGPDMLFCGSDISCFKLGLRSFLKEVRDAGMVCGKISV